MCRLGPSVAKKVPGVMKEDGALPRDVAGNADIPSLGTEGIHVGRSGDGRGEPQPEAKCNQNNVYNVVRDAGLSPRVQRGTDFATLTLGRSLREEFRGPCPDPSAFASPPEPVLR